jgi:hypothetical protein
MIPNFIKNDPDTKRKRRRSTWQFPLIYLGLAGAGALIGSTVMAVLFILAAVVWVCLYPLYLNKLVRRGIRKVIEENRSNDTFGAQTLSISPEGVASTNQTIRFEVKWKGITKIVPADTGIFIHTSSTAAVIIPDSAFDTVNTRERFLEEALRYREMAAGLIETV